ncbi:hypothetical protein Droror1_Dr00005738 [Drosera rotundifolia]
MQHESYSNHQIRFTAIVYQLLAMDTISDQRNWRRQGGCVSALMETPLISDLNDLRPHQGFRFTTIGHHGKEVDDEGTDQIRGISPSRCNDLRSFIPQICALSSLSPQQQRCQGGLCFGLDGPL